jgi:hypothetical protein
MWDTLSFLYSKNDVSGIFIEKILYQNIEKTLFFDTFESILALWDKNQKIEPSH